MINGHGDDAFRFGRPIRANFSSNVYAHVDQEPLLAHLRSRLEVIRNYPEPEPYRLEQALSARLGIDPASVCVTSGATEAIYLIAQAFHGAHSTVFQPAFNEYADACRLHGHTVVSCVQPGAGAGHSGKAELSREGLSVPPSGWPEKAPDKPALVWICNPNNPTGGVIPKSELEALMSSHPETVFVIDASYGFFTREALLAPAEAVCYPNLIQLHSMTKRYAMPGLRLGYMTGPAALIEQIRSCRMPWSVNALAVEAGLFLTEHPDTAPIDRDALFAETDRLRTQINALPGVEALPTQTHFFLCRLAAGRTADLKHDLAENKGILIRDASNFEGLDARYFRIATQTPEENEALVSALGAWLQKEEAQR